MKTESENEANVPFMFSGFMSNNNEVIKGNYEEMNGEIILKAAFIKDNKSLKRIEVIKKTVEAVGVEVVQQLNKYFREL